MLLRTLALVSEVMLLVQPNDMNLQDLIQWLPYTASRWHETLARFKQLATDITFDGENNYIEKSAEYHVLCLFSPQAHLGITSMKRRLKTRVW